MNNVRFMVLPYSVKSEGAKLIAEAIGGKRIKLENSEYKYQPGDCVVNWGNGHGNVRVPKDGIFLNRDVNIAIDKKAFFLRLEGHGLTPRFALTTEEARRHLTFPVVCRTVLEGADGQGVVIAENKDKLVPAKLYTQLLPKKAEYRIHLGRKADGTVVLIAAQKKRHVKDHKVDPRIWTGDSVVLDWLEPREVPAAVLDVTVKAMGLLTELTFGGFDTIAGDFGARVVEVNSAPMMTPATIAKYTAFIHQYAEDAMPKPVAKPAPVAPREAPAKVVRNAYVPQQDVLGVLLRIEQLLIQR